MLHDAKFTGWKRSLLLSVILLSITGCQSTASQSKTIAAPPKAQAVETPGIGLNPALYKEGFSAPTALAFDQAGNMYVANWSGGTVSKVDTAGNIKTFASIAGSPAGLAFDKQGVMYVSDYRSTIYRITADGKTSVFATGLHTPTGINFNKKGELLVTNRSSNEVVKISPGGEVSAFAKGFHTPVGVVEHPDGSVYIANYGGGISKVDKNGTVTTVATDFGTPGCGIVVFNGDVLVVDNGRGMVKNLGTDGSQMKVIVQNLKQPVALGINLQGKIFVGTWGDGAIYGLE